MTLAGRIKEAMGDMKKSAFARKAKVTPAAVTQWLDGTTKSLRAETAALIEAATGYRASWIVTGKGPKKVADADGQAPTVFDKVMPEEWDLLLDFRAMMDEDQEELRAEIAKRAERIRSHMRKVGKDRDYPLVAERANARRPKSARVEADITPALKQRDLLDEA